MNLEPALQIQDEAYHGTLLAKLGLGLGFGLGLGLGLRLGLGLGLGSPTAIRACL